MKGKEGLLKKRIKKLLGDSSIEFMLHASILEAKKDFPKREDFQHAPLAYESIDGVTYAQHVKEWFERWFGSSENVSH